MCGIFGYIHKERISDIDQINPETILHHRGPDDFGWLLYDGSEVTTGKTKIPNIVANVFLLHKRLSIIDLSASASQPLNCENNRYYVLFNGEIYNYLELKDELKKQGHLFATQGDSEVLLKAYIHWGENCLQHLVGMFAFAIFDRQLNKIFFARDAFGIKPFYYYIDEERFLFASEIKSLIPFISKTKINSEQLFFYLRSGLTDFKEATLFRGIKQLPAGFCANLSINDISAFAPRCYWQPTISTNHDLTFQEAAHKLRDLFLKNIALHLRSDVPVGAALSGGIDSSSIVMAMRHLFSSININTFSYIADETALSEESWIDIVNEHAGTIPHKVYAHPNSLLTDLEQLISIQDEPFGSTSIYAQHRIFQTAKTVGIKVMLDGQGADEMLGGYSFYVVARFVSLLKQYKFQEAMRLLQNTSTSNILLRSLHYLLPPAIRTLLRKLTRASHTPAWLNTKWFLAQGDNIILDKNKYGKNVLQEELLHTFNCSSLPMLLRYEDRNSMAFSIESRVPFLTQELVEFIFSLPEKFLISENGLSKAVFREAMRGIVPQSILDRRDKIGFATPERKWLQVLRPWVESVIYSDYARSLPMFNHKHLIADWQLMLAGKTTFDFRYWRWINFIKWSEMHQLV